MKLEQAARQALDALKDYHKADDDRVSVAISILQEALAEQAEQGPVAFVSDVYQRRYTLEWNGRSLPVGTKLYTAPVRTKDLTDDEVAKAYMECTGGDIIARCRAVIAADREKNRGTA